jgi:hypothetical protein
VGELFWVLVPNKVDPSKVDPRIVALTGVCDGCVDVSAKLGTPPKIGGRFLKHRDRWGCCGSPMVLDYMWMCASGGEKK